jgi:tetratricopeptide (TPR) repeat protein
LWQGVPLSGVRGEWAERQRRRLEQVREEAVEERFAADVERGAHREVVAALTQAVADAPLRERLRELLMLALYRSGRQAEALEVYAAGFRVVDEELGIAPGAGLRELHQAILRADPDLDLPAGVLGLASPAGSGVAAMRSLPRDVAGFTGRAAELEVLAGAADRAGGVVSVHAIGGMAGVGKTAFAVHAGHVLADRFPDGQVFVPLHGHTPGQVPAEPADALGLLLLAAGVAAAQIPAGLQERMALWRDRVAGRRLLLILDDAVDSGQVEPLLPGTGGSLVLVTSRRQLSALEAATAVSLDTLPAPEAAGLLVALAGRAGLGAGHPGGGELVRLCGYLPLAIGMVARQLRHHPAWPVAGRAGELAAARDRLGLLVTENLSVAAAFDLSYADLTGDQRRLFRRLGLHPGAEFDGYAAAALDGTSVAEARRGLEGLYDQYLLTEPAPGRYRMHDLIREHARALAGETDPASDREAAVGRLLEYYARASAAADARIDRQTRPGRTTTQDAVTAVVPDLFDREQALAWARTERANLIACLGQATAAGQPTHIVALTAGLAGLLRRDGPWAEAITPHETAIEVAERLGDRLEQANALCDLGIVRRMTGAYSTAARAHERALEIYRGLGDRLGEANALCDLGAVWRMTGDNPASVQLLEQWALDLYRDLGDRLGEASALSDLGFVHLETCDYQTAAQDHEQALDLYRDLGDRLGQAGALSELGAVRRLTGNYPGAVEAQEQALGMHRDLGNRLGQAGSLSELGIVWRLTGDFPAAVRAHEQALEIYRDLGNRLGEANALSDLGIVWRLTGDYPAAVRAHERALHTYRDLGSRPGQANALRDLGTVRRLVGDYPVAVQAMEQALDIYRDLGNRAGQMDALNERAALYLAGGSLAEAGECYGQALDLARAIASSWGEAHVLAGLGRCALAGRHHEQAREFLEEALAIFQKIGAAEVGDISAELAAFHQ